MNTPRGFICCGGDMRKIRIHGKVHEFEYHHYCGPTLLKKNGEPRSHQPYWFLRAASLWCQQGCRMDGEMCVWDEGELSNSNVHVNMNQPDL